MFGIGIALAGLFGVWLGARRFGRGRPCPVTVAALFDNELAGRLGRTSLLISRAGVSDGMRVLDAGCGPGRVTIPLARRVGSTGAVVALDVQQGMLDRVRRNATREGLRNVTTLLAALEPDAPALRDQQERFDRALLVTVLGEVPDPVGALRALHGALKPGGILSITEMLVDPDYVSRRRVRDLAAAAGFVADEQFGSVVMYTANFRKPASPGPNRGKDEVVSFDGGRRRPS